MGIAGTCERCGWESSLGHTVRWRGSLATSYRCGKCKGTGTLGPPPAPHIIGRAEWPLARMEMLLKFRSERV